MSKKRTKPTVKETENFDMLEPMLDSFYEEVKELSKKKQDEHLNKLKVSMINRVLNQILEVISIEDSKDYLNVLDEAELPTNSDAVLILSQFQAAMKLYRKKHYGYDDSSGEDKWFTSKA